jgi:hypothetical protein
VDRLFRLTLCVALLELFFLCAPALRRVVPEELSPDPREWVHWLREYNAAAERREELKKNIAALQLREQLRQRIYRELIAGRLTLREAARRCADLPEPSGAYWENTRLHFPPAGSEAARCREVLEEACGLLQDETGPAEALCRRLEAEFREIFSESEARGEGPRSRETESAM